MQVILHVDNIKVSKGYGETTLQVSPTQDLLFSLDVDDSFFKNVPHDDGISKALDIEGVRFIIKSVKKLIYLDEDF